MFGYALLVDMPDVRYWNVLLWYTEFCIVCKCVYAVLPASVVQDHVLHNIQNWVFREMHGRLRSSRFFWGILRSVVRGKGAVATKCLRAVRGQSWPP